MTMEWKVLAYVALFGVLAAYSTWLYAMVLKDRQDDRRDLDYLATRLGIKLPRQEKAIEEAATPTPTEELPAVAETELMAVKSRHRPTADGRSVHDILAEAGQEPLKGRRGR